MLDERIIDKLVDRLVDRIEKGNTYVLKKVGENIKKIGSIKPGARNSLLKVLKYGGNYDKIVNELARITELNVKDIYDIFEEIAKTDYRFAEKFYKYRDVKYIPYEENKSLQRQVRALAKITAKEYMNISKTTGFSTIKDGKTVYTSLENMYQQVIDEGILSVEQGKDTFDRNMSRIIKQLGNSGIRTIDYESGYSKRLDSAVRMNLKEGLSRLHNEIQEDFGKEFDSDGVEISVHLYPAKDHENIQGHQYTNEEYKKLNESLERPIGTLNCYHYIFSIIMGVSEPNHTKKELQEIIDNNKKGFKLDGKHYTMYEGTQLQRRIETEIRKTKDIQIMAKSSGNKELMGEMQERISELTYKYRELSKISGLPTKLERAKISGYRRTKVTPTIIKPKPVDIPKIEKETPKTDYILPKLRTRQVDKGIAEETIKGINNLAKEYPYAMKRDLPISYNKVNNRNDCGGETILGAGYKKDRFGTVYGYNVNYNTIRLKVRDYVNNLDRYKQFQKYQYESKWQSTDNINHSLYHEYGHALVREINVKLGKKDNLVDELLKYQYYRPSTAKTMDLNIILRELSKNTYTEKLLDDVLAEYSKVKNIDNNFSLIIRNNVSKYGATSKEEAFAELFAKVMNKDTDDLTKIFKNELDKTLKEIYK